MNSEKDRVSITNFLQWNDKNGCYTDDNCVVEEVPIMTYEDAVLYAKKNTFYGKTIQKLELLTSNDNPTIGFYRILI